MKPEQKPCCVMRQFDEHSLDCPTRHTPIPSEVREALKDVPGNEYHKLGVLRTEVHRLNVLLAEKDEQIEAERAEHAVAMLTPAPRPEGLTEEERKALEWCEDDVNHGCGSPLIVASLCRRLLARPSGGEAVRPCDLCHGTGIFDGGPKFSGKARRCPNGCHKAPTAPDAMREALEKIANQDYRGHPCSCAGIAKAALAPEKP
jgi:LSD1 subclass zinc finger protein